MTHSQITLDHVEAFRREVAGYNRHETAFAKLGALKALTDIAMWKIGLGQIAEATAVLEAGKQIAAWRPECR